MRETQNKYLPQEWEFLSLVKTTSLNMYLLILFLFLAMGWVAGVVAMLGAWLIDYVGLIISRGKYSKQEQEFTNYIASGLRPYLVYATTDALATKWSFVADSQLSTCFAEIKSHPLIFDKHAVRVVLVFLSDKQQKEIVKESFASSSKAKDFYVKKISHLPLYMPTDKNMATIKEVLINKQDIEDVDYIEELKEKITKSLSKGSKK